MRTEFAAKAGHTAVAQIARAKRVVANFFMETISSAEVRGEVRKEREPEQLRTAFRRATRMKRWATVPCGLGHRTRASPDGGSAGAALTTVETGANAESRLANQTSCNKLREAQIEVNRTQLTDDAVHHGETRE